MQPPKRTSPPKYVQMMQDDGFCRAGELHRNLIKGSSAVWLHQSDRHPPTSVRIFLLWGSHISSMVYLFVKTAMRFQQFARKITSWHRNTRCTRTICWRAQKCRTYNHFKRGAHRLKPYICLSICKEHHGPNGCNLAGDVAKAASIIYTIPCHPETVVFAIMLGICNYRKHCILYLERGKRICGSGKVYVYVIAVYGMYSNITV